MSLWKPYPKQLQFHNAGAKHRERLFLAGNQLGKTICAGVETAYHLTGLYPDWWKGKRFDGPTRFWAACNTNESTRNNPQRILMGEGTEWGTGTIPKALIARTTMSRGMPDFVDTVEIKHVTGGISRLQLKSYEQAREKWQGMTLHGVWFDEEPPSDIYSEGLTRTNATKGITYITATPLLGMTDVVSLFFPEPRGRDRNLVMMDIEEVEHYSPEEVERVIAGYLPHEREARSKGIPILGSGRVFNVPEELISIQPFDIPKHWPQIGGIDFGWDHPTACVWAAHDRDSDVLYITHAYGARETTPIVHASAMKARGDWIPWAWPHDGYIHDKQSGMQIAEAYKREGIRMLHTHSTFMDGSWGLEAGVMDLLDRMQSGRLKVFEHLEPWWAEYRLYHRKDGRIVKERDDFMSATRYLLMMLRFARTGGSLRFPSVTGLDYDPLNPQRIQDQSYLEIN
jgi:phage terminase large subunit-like protein